MDRDVSFSGDPAVVKIFGYMGDDNAPCYAALVRNPDLLHDHSLDEGRLDRLREDLVMKGHYGCFEHQAVTLYLETPIFVARQVMRHRTFSYNEYSMRYKDLEPRFYEPETFFKDVKRKELGDVPTPVEEQTAARQMFEVACTAAWARYRDLLDYGVRKEQASRIMPLETFTSFYMTGNLRNWWHFLNLRVDAHAQIETRVLAKKIEGQLDLIWPKSMNLWRRYGRGPLGTGLIQTP